MYQNYNFMIITEKKKRAYLQTPWLRLVRLRVSGIPHSRFLLWTFLETQHRPRNRSMVGPHQLRSSSCDSACGERWRVRSWSSVPGWWPRDQTSLPSNQMRSSQHLQRPNTSCRRESDDRCKCGDVRYVSFHCVIKTLLTVWWRKTYPTVSVAEATPSKRMQTEPSTSRLPLYM